MTELPDDHAWLVHIVDLTIQALALADQRDQFLLAASLAESLAIAEDSLRVLQGR